MESRKVEDDKSTAELKNEPLSQFTCGRDMFFRADQVDLKNLDIQLEKKLSKIWLKDVMGSRRTKEEWEIDLSKLKIRYVVARGTYGTVYRGTYDEQDVAVKLLDWGADGHATDAETSAAFDHHSRKK
ncbi:hypothetical protein HPP92_023239 [Vanilla planifolia]|uniref:Uncharacterized protein n=1 Tax=Vanilla planifolia TaxID=51239 RepID=A0A835PX82_VANPL|nr:hypothetical protein HPP92_023239 [Vanilla planifolia]